MVDNTGLRFCREDIFFFCNCIHLTHLLKPSVMEARSLGDTEVNTAYLLSSWIQHSMAAISKSQHLLQALEQIYYLAGRESLAVGLYSVNSLYVNVKCIHLFYWGAMGNILYIWGFEGEGWKGKPFISAFCFLWWPQAFVVIRNSSPGRERKQMVYL